MRMIDADALIDDLMERYCKECNKRRGIKNGKYRIIYEVGEVPCRACEVDDVKAELEEAPTLDAVPVIYCKDCGHYNAGFECLIEGYGIDRDPTYFCGDAIPKIERKE